MATIDHYELQWDTDPGEPYANTETIPPGEPLEFTTPAQVEGTTVYGRVRAVSTDGFAGPWSAEVSAYIEITPVTGNETLITGGDVITYDPVAGTAEATAIEDGQMNHMPTVFADAPPPIPPVETRPTVWAVEGGTPPDVSTLSVPSLT